MNGGTRYWSFDVADDKEIHKPRIHDVRAALKTLKSFVLLNELEETFMKVTTSKMRLRRRLCSDPSDLNRQRFFYRD